MIGMSPQTHLLVAWLSVAVVSILGAAAVFIWAVRTRQFSKQDRARYLALDDVPPEDDAEGEPRPKEEKSNHVSS